MAPCLFLISVLLAACANALSRSGYRGVQDPSWNNETGTLSLQPGAKPETEKLEIPDYNPAEHECSAQEHEVLAPVERIVTKIKGRISTDGTVLPLIAPKECHEMFPSMNQRTVCYLAWGFTYGVAKCWAEEDRANSHDCAVCEFPGPGSVLCQKCKARLRKEKFACAEQYMGISYKCRSCLRRAREYWDGNCMMQCAQAAVTGRGLTPTCLECNDHVSSMKYHCGLA